MRVARQLVLVLGFAAAAILFASVLSTPQTVETGWLAWWPECAARRAGSACSLCGMSHAFIAMSHGRFDEAQQLNRHAIWLYPVFLMTSLLAVALASGEAGRLVRAVRGRRGPGRPGLR